MALLNPVYALLVPFLFVVTIPLAILAGITTTLAFSVLMFRVAVVYLDIAVNMVPQYVTGRRVYPFPGRFMNSLLSAAMGQSSTNNIQPSQNSLYDSRPASGQTTPSPTHHAATNITTNRNPAVVRHHRRRRTSGASFTSVGSITPIDDAAGIGLGSKRNSFMMIPSVGIDRDFEGVGGWRLSDKNGDADDDAWAQLNSRLELPVEQQRRHHRRSHSGGGATTPGGGDYLVMKSPRAARSKEGSPENTAGRRGRERGKGAVPAMSPNCSRQRTPTNGMPPPLTTIDSTGSYFPPMISPKAARKVVL